MAIARAETSAEASAETSVTGLRSGIGAVRDRAWRAIYDQNFGRMYRLVCRFGVAQQDVEDVTQRAFMIAYRRLEQMEEMEEVRDLGAWLRGIAVRVVAEHRRWHRVRAVKRWLLESTAAAATPNAPSPEQKTAAAQEVERIRLVLDRMSGKLRDVLVLTDIEEVPLGEVAQILEIPVNTVRSRRRLARAQFQKLWQRRFGEVVTYE